MAPAHFSLLLARGFLWTEIAVGSCIRHNAESGVDELYDVPLAEAEAASGEAVKAMKAGGKAARKQRAPRSSPPSNDETGGMIAISQISHGNVQWVRKWLDQGHAVNVCAWRRSSKSRVHDLKFDADRISSATGTPRGVWSDRALRCSHGRTRADRGAFP